MLDEPWVSAVVEVLPPETEPATSVTETKMKMMSTVKTHFTQAGFEVHAPFTTSFSIAAKQSLFEQVFGVKLVVDQEQLSSTVTTDAGEVELPLGGLPEDVRSKVKNIGFIPPPNFGP